MSVVPVSLYCGLIYPFTKAFIHLFMCMLCNEERKINMAIPQCSVTIIELNNTKIAIHQITSFTGVLISP
jgi:hypothetical protein